MPSHVLQSPARDDIRGRGDNVASVANDVDEIAIFVGPDHATMYPFAISWSSVQPDAWYCSRVNPPAAAVIV